MGKVSSPSSLSSLFAALNLIRSTISDQFAVLFSEDSYIFVTSVGICFRFIPVMLRWPDVRACAILLRSKPLLSFPSSTSTIGHGSTSGDWSTTPCEELIAFLFAAFAFAIVSRRAAEDFGELFASSEGGGAAFGAAFCFLDCADGGVDGAIAFSPLVFGLSSPER